MNNSPQHLTERIQFDSNGIDVATTVSLLRKYAYLERAMIRAIAAWFLRLPAYEVKIAMGYHLWSHAEHVQALRCRLHELRGGHHEANIQPALTTLAEQLLDAPDEASFLIGWRTALSSLRKAYAWHLQSADSAANASEIRLLKPILVDTDQILAWLDTQVDASPSAQHLLWEQYIQACVSQAEVHAPHEMQNTQRQVAVEGRLGGAGHSEGAVAPGHPRGPQRPSDGRYRRPTTLVFDDRIQRGSFESYDDRLALSFADHRIAECQIYFNEFFAAALLATIILDAWSTDAPWSFFHDMSHHFWDEVRHAEFGMIRLRELGVEPSKVDLSLFEASGSLPFLHRLCYLTLGLEVFFMPRKKPRVKRYQEAGDHRTQLFADIDWSDEGNHVQYGKKWVQYFLESDARSIVDLQQEISQLLNKAGVNLPQGQLAPY